MTMPKPAAVISVIIPALNEAESVSKAVAAVPSGRIGCEVIVVDAGSVDETPGIARKAGARVLRSHRRQRAYQLNLGARQARGDVLLFLHADTLLPPNALPLIDLALRDQSVAGGAFRRRYDSSSLLLQATCLLAGWRNRLIGWHLGDQAMFVRASTFFELGGFVEADQFEDLDFSRRLRRTGRVVTVPSSVTSSARRFDRQGPALTTLQDLGFTVRYLVYGLPRRSTVPLSPAKTVI
ncbi:MAG: TIGR04283 family arsenosugar biosynthesis glycosyltransferase [Chthoniobacterales bacterium]